MTQTKALSLFLAVALMLTLATVTWMPAVQSLTVALLPDPGNSAAVTAEYAPDPAPAMACGGCSGGGSGGG